MSTHASRGQVTLQATAALKKTARSNIVKAALPRTPGKGNPKKFQAFSRIVGRGLKSL